MNEREFLCVIMPVLNEEACLEQALTSLAGQLSANFAEILVMDGGSRDQTRAIAGRLAVSCPMIRVIDNPARLQSAGCNLAAQLANPSATILIRADAHAGYPANFVGDIVSALRREHATSVVVPMRTVGKQFMQRAIAATQNSVLGNGGSRHRRAAVSQFVDHGHHAAFDAAFFRSTGGYDASFTHNEDAEFDIRATLRGGRAWLCAEAAIDYYPRETLSALSRQYRQHGKGRARTTLKHRVGLKPRQLAPLILLGSFAADILAPALPLIAVPSCLYVLCCMLWGTRKAIVARDPAMLLIGPVSMTMHLSWAVGFLQGRWNQSRSNAIPIVDSTSPPLVAKVSL